ncbi:hypothetical protein HY404_00630 [Candidatus Microgenomates bacterium]|nr:hypothetical protein [Candidatus Microgenomates bacterium]
MKSYLPIFLLILGVLVVAIAGFSIFNLRSKDTTPSTDEVVVPTIPLPYVALTPDGVGQELTLSVTGIDSAVATLDYELVYNTAAGVLQGVPGSVSVSGKSSLERKLTLGTCSSGVCRYDKGVKDITLTLRLRNSSGKVLAKVATGVSLLSKTKKLASTDDKFSLTLDKTPTGFYVVMQTSGLPSESSGTVVAGPYGVFTSGSSSQRGKITTVGIWQVWDGNKWQVLSDGATKTLGVFVATQ